MALNHLICPYCGKPIVLDGSHVLQTRWNCPYCRRQLFLLQKAGEISLHGVINTERSESDTPDMTDEPDLAAGETPAAGNSTDQQDHSAVKPQEHAQQIDYEELVQAVAEAARQRHLPRFNSLSRQALTINPTDGRIYAWRAILTEQADGFTRSCWSSPQWLLRTPNQRNQLLKQHFYGLNTALLYIASAQECQQLVGTIAQQIARQISEYFTETARLRLAGKKRNKPFSGRYRRKDLTAAPALHMTLISLTEVNEADYGQLLHQLILSELETENPQLLHYLTSIKD